MLLQLAREGDSLIRPDDRNATRLGIHTEMIVSLALAREPRLVVGVELVVVCTSMVCQLKTNNPNNRTVVHSPRHPNSPLAGQRISGKSFGSMEMRGLEMMVIVSMTESISALGGV